MDERKDGPLPRVRAPDAIRGDAQQADSVAQEGSVNINSIDEYEQAHSTGWHRGFAAGFACAAVVALATVFCLLAYGTFDKPAPQPVKSDASKRPTGK
jgi:hypothetical protein